MLTIKANGEELAYERAGSGPPLILVHSLGTGAWLWKDQIEKWKADFDVIAFDARGHGSSTNRGGVTMRAIAGDILAALEKLEVGPAHFLGISMGGLICARIYEEAPDRVLSLVIADSFPTLGEAGMDRVKALEQTIGPITRCEEGRVDGVGTSGEATPRGQEARRARRRAGMGKGSDRQTVGAVFTEDVVGCLAAVKVPALVVVGENDNRTPPAASRKIVEIVGHADFALVPASAHLANLDNPDGFHAAVDPFLRRQLES